jgi:CMP-2-keto-3-deoxyoctulosonic acid synthetase
LITNLESVGVDTPEDLVRAEAKLLEKMKNL